MCHACWLSWTAQIFFFLWIVNLICAFLPSSSFLYLPSRPPDFNYNTDGYEGEAAEDGKSQDGSETLPYIDESPTMSPQLCASQGMDRLEGLIPGVNTHTQDIKLLFSVLTYNVDKSPALSLGSSIFMNI